MQQPSAFLALCISALLVLGSSPSGAADENEGTALPVPRFVSLKSDEVNLRTGPGDRYPINWVYKRAHLPVEVIEEFDHWRKIRDFEGTEGWVHKSLLEGRRTAMVKGDTRMLRRAPDESAAPILRAEAMVIGKLLECTPKWCRLQIDSRKGWIKKSEMWGVSPREELD